MKDDGGEVIGVYLYMCVIYIDSLFRIYFIFIFIGSYKLCRIFLKYKIHVTSNYNNKKWKLILE